MKKKNIYRKSFIAVMPDGKKKKVTRSSTKSEKDAIRKRDLKKAQYQAGLLTLGKKITVAEYAEQFEKEVKLSADDCGRLRRLLVEKIGQIKLEEVKAYHIRQCYALLEGMSKSSIAKGCALIKRFFDAAIVSELIIRNPCLRVPRPTAKAFVGRRSMTEEEENRFLQTIRERISHQDGRNTAMWLISYACGLRPGEVRALTLKAIVLNGERPRIMVTQACKSKTREIGPPKTEAGRREIPIPQKYIPLLRPIVKGTKGNYLFSWYDGGPIGHRSYLLEWKQFAKIANLPDDLDPYSLRHTYCTNLAFAGVQIVSAMKWMGHSDPTMIQKVYADAENQKLLRRDEERLNAERNTLENTSL